MHFVQNADGGLYLKANTPASELVLKIVVSLIGGLILMLGFSILRGNPIVGIAFLIGGFTAFSAGWTHKGMGSEFNALSRVAIIRPTYAGRTSHTKELRLVFDRIQRIEVWRRGNDQFSHNSIHLITDQGEYQIADKWEMWKAENLVQRLGGIIRCPILDSNALPLQPIYNSQQHPTAKPPPRTIATHISTGLAIGGLGLILLGLGYVAYRPMQSFTKPVAITRPTTIAINQQGELHVYSPLLDRIQIFNPKGQFQRSLRITGGRSKYGLYLCGGGDQPIMMANKRGATYELKSNGPDYRQPKSALSKVCRATQNQSAVTWRDQVYTVRSKPLGLVMRQGGGDRVLLQGDWLDRLIIEDALIIFPAVSLLLGGIFGIIMLGRLIKQGIKHTDRASRT
ncbi:hypothetical protein IQ266_22445 [filamentous cyanobacterium LEGE 11480]|uniref:Uncharacterized protein n=1 Tax=Romeriopsis navalis LEGE 11480 TaxID=2777977 RepID=A0A928VRN6_9CYAN|nr:hypothetical protein [Romeriopsis navalis]MBE9032502.1 hypothetical protein [Romeriopsis navalis LEGE 11480]